MANLTDTDSDIITQIRVLHSLLQTCEKLDILCLNREGQRALIGLIASLLELVKELQSVDEHKPLVEKVLWIAALDRVPIEERVEWVETMLDRVAYFNATKAVKEQT